MKRLLLIVIAVAVTAGCGGGHQDGGSSPSPSGNPQLNADACRAFNDSLALTRQAIRSPRASLAVQTATTDEAPKVDQAAQLADGDTQRHMQRAAAALRLWGQKQQQASQRGFSDDEQVTAVRNAAALVAADCRNAGVTVQLVG